MQAFREVLPRFGSGAGRPATTGSVRLVLPGWKLSDAPEKQASLVVSRGLLRHAFWPLKEKRRDLLLSALDVQLRAWAPFAEPAYMILPGTAGVTVFAWDAARIAELQQKNGLPRDRLPVCPESAMYAPIADGVRLVVCAVGVEGQVWKEGMLTASRWWSAPPDVLEWRNFQRGAGLAPERHTELEQATVSLPMQPTPWPGMTTYDALLDRVRIKWHLLAAGLVTLLLLPTLWLLRQAMVVDEQLQTLVNEKEQLMLEAAPLIEARERFERDFVLLSNLRKYREHPNAVDLLAHLVTVLGGQRAALRELAWQSGDSIRLTIVPAPDVQRVTYIKALEDAGWLEDVREAPESVPNALIFEAQLKPAPVPESKREKDSARKEAAAAAGPVAGTAKDKS